MTWTCCGTARCPPVRRSPRAVHAGLAPALLYLGQREQLEKAAGVPGGAGRQAPLLPARASSPSSTSTRCKNASTATRSRARGSGTRRSGEIAAGEGPERAGRDGSTPLSAPVIAAPGCAAGTPPPPRRGSIAVRRWAPPGLRLHRDHHRPDGLRVLQRRGDNAIRCRTAGSPSRPDERQHPRRDRIHPEDAWTAIRYRALPGTTAGCLGLRRRGRRNRVHGVRVEERPGRHRRLIVRGSRQNKKAAAGQDELFPVWRYHAVFTDSPFQTVQAEGQHRDHAVVEQVFADVTSGPLAHMPSGHFAANAAWLSIAAMAHNLVRAAGALASLPTRRPAPRPSAAT